MDSLWVLVDGRKGEDELERLQRLAALTGIWTLLWTVCLNVVPRGHTGKNHVISLNAAHGTAVVFLASYTLFYDMDTAASTAASLGFFIVDMGAMLRADGIGNLHRLNGTRLMDYAHHVLGIVWGSVFFWQESSVCDPTLGNPYVWIQTNEVSTPFYNWFRLTQSTTAGMLFVLSFFASRIVFNTAIFIPRLLKECDTRYLWPCIPFFILQYVWFGLIVKKLRRTVGGKKKD